MLVSYLNCSDSQKAESRLLAWHDTYGPPSIHNIYINREKKSKTFNLLDYNLTNEENLMSKDYKESNISGKK